MAENVGSVSIRVRPDSTRFASELKAQLSKIKDLTITVNLDLDKGAIDAELAKLRASDIKIPAEVDVQQDSLGKALAGIKPIHIPAEIDIDQNQLGRAVAGRTIHIRGEVDVDRNRISRAFSAIGSAGKSVFSEIGSIGSAAISGVGESVSELGKGFSTVGDIAGTVLGVAKFAAIGFAIAEGGAAITAAWGAASTAIAAVPAAIGLIGAPLAAVLLGMDGIKKAAATLTPEFTKLKAAVSSTFQAGLTPVFNQLRTSLTAITPQIQAVAASMVGLAQQTANWITNSGGLQLIQTAFTNIASAIGNINIVPLVDGFTRLAGNQAALKVLTTTINQLGVEIQKIANNPALDQAFAGLEGVLKSVTTAFGDLVNNGITLFANAAPGAQAAIDGIGQFFNKFDWGRLGAAVGTALQGIGDALKNIPQSTVDAITTSFERLGQVLGSGQVQGAIQAIAGQLPGLVTGFSDVVAGIADVVLKLDSAGAAAQAVANGDFKLAGQLIKNTFSDVSLSVVRDANGIPIGLTAAGTASLSAVTGTFGQIRPAIDSSLSGAAAAAAVQATRIKTGFIGPISPLPGEAQQIAGKVGPGVTAGMANAPAAAQAGGVATAQGLKVGLQAAPGFVNDAFVAIGPLINEAMAGLATYVSFGTVTLANALSTGLTTNLGPAMTAGLGLLGTQVTTFFATTMSLAVGTGMLQMGNAVTIGLIGVQTAFTTGLGLIATGVTTFFATTLSLSVGTGMLQFGNAVTLGLVGVQLAFTTGLGLIATGVTTFFATTLSLSVGTGMLQMSNAVTLGMAAVQNAFTAGFGLVNTAVGTAMTNVTAAITAGFVGSVGATTTGMTNIKGAVDTGATQVVTAVTTMMTNFTKAVTDGGKNAVTAVKQVTTDMKAAIDVNILEPTGFALMQGLAAGINRGSSIVQDAVKKVVADAKAAADAAAKVNSPSKLFRDGTGLSISEGLGDGILKGSGYVQDSVRQAIRSAYAAAQHELDQTFLASNGILSDLDTRIRAEVNSGSFDLADSSSGGDVVLPVTVNVGNEFLGKFVQKISDADKADLLLKLRAG